MSLLRLLWSMNSVPLNIMCRIMSHSELVLHAFDGGNGLNSTVMTAVIYHMLISL